MSNDWISGAAAMERLGVQAQTLYAYVSRGRVEARPDPADPRRSLYRAADIAELTRRRVRGRKPSAVAEGAIAWGEPVLASAITTLSGGRLWYRGRDAAVLARTETLETVARLLRGGHGVVLKAADRPPPPVLGDARARLFAALADRAAREPPARGRAPLALAMEGAGLMDLAADAVAGGVGTGPIHERLAAAWGMAPGGADALRQALVLLADHELNASTFAARVAASTGAGLAASALAGLCALSGPLHGGMAARVFNLLEESRRIGAGPTVEGRLARGAPTPGFGHPLYPEGDPRAVALLAACPATGELAALQAAVEMRTGERANIDFALVVLAETHGLPPDAPFLLFAVARSAGWIAHAVEEGASGRLIRPRARYIGPPVGPQGR
jgi:citrate synthase